MDVSLEPLSQNFTRVWVGDVSIWFSYKTPVAFSHLGRRVVRQNDWSTTTGKHLNEIDGGTHGNRVTGLEFEKLLAEAMK
jgi:hypothetical protein